MYFLLLKALLLVGLSFGLVSLLCFLWSLGYEKSHIWGKSLCEAWEGDSLAFLIPLSPSLFTLSTPFLFLFCPFFFFFTIYIVFFWAIIYVWR